MTPTQEPARAGELSVAFMAEVCDAAFADAMKGRQYGTEETEDARAWFKAGWRARDLAHDLLIVHGAALAAPSESGREPNIEMAWVPVWKMRRAAAILERDGDEHGIGRDLRDMLAAVESARKRNAEREDAARYGSATGNGRDGEDAARLDRRANHGADTMTTDTTGRDALRARAEKWLQNLDDHAPSDDVLNLLFEAVIAYDPDRVGAATAALATPEPAVDGDTVIGKGRDNQRQPQGTTSGGSPDYSRPSHLTNNPAPESAIPMLLHCPRCHVQHIDEEEWETTLHRSHECQQCGCIWRPADVPTVGVAAINTRGKADTPIVMPESATWEWRPGPLTTWRPCSEASARDMKAMGYATRPAPAAAVTDAMVERAFTRMRGYDCFFVFDDESLRGCIRVWLTAALAAEGTREGGEGEG